MWDKNQILPPGLKSSFAARPEHRSLLFCTPAAGAEPEAGGAPVQQPFIREARFYSRQSNSRVKCLLCPHACGLNPSQRGLCGVRENRNGSLCTLVYSRLCSAHVDPIEKKPLFHYLPSSQALSIATAGCNVSCTFCQNWELSRSQPEQIPAEYAPPERIASLAAQIHCPTIAYTYSEPMVFAEYLMDVADAAHAAGVRSIAVSNGYILPQPLREVYGRMDAVKIDLKAFSDGFYRDVVGARLKPVLHTLATLREMGKWLEIVYLIVPTLNDSEQEIRGLAQWIQANLGPDVPLHFMQFHPAHELKHLPITPVATLERAKAIADAEGLHYVYIGNVPGHPAQNTLCPGCQKIVVERVGFATSKVLVGPNNACPNCHHAIAGLWS